MTTMRDYAMTKTRERIAVMQAYLEGRKIEARMKFDDGTKGGWHESLYPSWVWETFEYRIADEQA